MRMVIAVAWMLVAASVVAGGIGGDPEIVTDEDALFGSEDDLFGADDDLFGGELIAPARETGTRIDEGLLIAESVEIGGRYVFTVEATAIWDDAFTAEPRYRDPDEVSMSTALSSRLFLDARPARDFRVFGQMTVSYPFETGDSRGLQDVFMVEELFSDFTWSDALFFRAGLQTLNWGVGTFYSPANLLRPGLAGPMDPDARQSGTIALRASIPIRVNHADAYLLFPATVDSQPLHTGAAARVEFVIGDGEVALGGRYQRDTSPAAMIVVTRSVGDFDVFGEGMLRYGSDRTFVEEAGPFPGLSVRRVDDELFASAMAGIRYAYTPAGAGWSVAAMAEYFYNGEGYDDPAIITDNPAAIGALLGAGEITGDDLATTGKHYSALSAATDLFGTNLNIAVVWLHNYTDRSALLVPSLSVTLLDHFALTLRTPVNLGNEGDGFAPEGNRVSVSLSASIGSGSF